MRLVSFKVRKCLLHAPCSAHLVGLANKTIEWLSFKQKKRKVFHQVWRKQRSSVLLLPMPCKFVFSCLLVKSKSSQGAIVLALYLLRSLHQQVFLVQYTWQLQNLVAAVNIDTVWCFCFYVFNFVQSLHFGDFSAFHLHLVSEVEDYNEKNVSKRSQISNKVTFSINVWAFIQQFVHFIGKKQTWVLKQRVSKAAVNNFLVRNLTYTLMSNVITWNCLPHSHDSWELDSDLTSTLANIAELLRFSSLGT